MVTHPSTNRAHHRLISLIETNDATITPVKGMCSGSRDLFKFGEISNIISEMVQDRDIVATED